MIIRSEYYSMRMKIQYREYKNIRPEHVFVGVGSDEAIDLLMRIFCTPATDAIIITPPTYGMYKVCAKVNDVPIISVPLSPEFDVLIPKVYKLQLRSSFYTVVVVHVGVRVYRRMLLFVGLGSLYLVIGFFFSTTTYTTLTDIRCNYTPSQVVIFMQSWQSNFQINTIIRYTNYRQSS
jgi:Aminotransferase class I and II